MPKLIGVKDPVIKKTFKQFLKELEDQDEAFRARTALFEHTRYKRIPGTSNSYRQDAGNTNTMTLRHSHVYAKLNGRGEELYAVNVDGSGHDGSGGIRIPTSHANYFRSNGYQIPDSNILESLDLDALDEGLYSLLIIKE